MSNVCVFLNTSIVRSKDFTTFASYEKNNLSLPSLMVSAGDTCLFPFRYFCSGNNVTIYTYQGKQIIYHERVRIHYHWTHLTSLEIHLKTVAMICLLIPGFFLGSFFKGLGYLSASIKEKHHIVVKHFTPIDRTIGSEEKRLTLEEIKEELKKYREGGEQNQYSQKAKTLKIFAKPGTTLKYDPGILELHPQKLILIGASIVQGELDECMVSWERTLEDRSVVVQHKMDSIEKAEADIPPTRSQWSFKQIRRVYVIEK